MRKHDTTETRNLRRAACAATVLAALCAPPAADAARENMQIARFAMTVKGTQVNDWNTDRTDFDGCVNGDVLTTGVGRERLTFTTPRAVPVQAIKIGKDVAFDAGKTGMPVTGTIERRGSMSVTQLSGGESGCGGAPQPEAPPVADCGTRTWSGVLRPTLYEPWDAPVENPLLQLFHVLGFSGPDLPEGNSPGSLFQACPGRGAQLLVTDTADLTPRRLFSKQRKITVNAKETITTSAGGEKDVVTVQWKAVLTRRGKTQTVPGRRAPARKPSAGRRGAGS